VVLLYEARIVNSLLGNFNFGIGLQCWALSDLGQIFVAHFQTLTYQRSQVVHCKNSLTFHKDDGYH